MTSFVEIQEQALQEWNELQNGDIPQIIVGTATCGRSAGAMAVIKAFEETLKEKAVEAQIVEAQLAEKSCKDINADINDGS